jgi:predicted CoA-binding protein
VNLDALDPAVFKVVYPPPLTVAVIGLSDRPGRPSHDVAGALLRWGYRVIPVNPGIESAHGIRSLPDLASVPNHVDVVDVFRRSEHVQGHLSDILNKKPRLLWLQDGVRDDHVAAEARRAGILVIQNDCIARRLAPHFLKSQP